VFRILLAEDNPADVLLFREALRESGVACEIVVAEDGQRAMALLKDVREASSHSRADLIVLDVNLPKHSGDEILENIRRDHSLAGVPVIMLTSSAAPSDQARASELGADLYIQKSSNVEELFAIGRAVERILRRKHPAASEESPA
jgi:DNA-binding response OmpR family regulator